MKKIKLVYWNGVNFGDALNPYLISRLSGMDVAHKVKIFGFKNNVRIFLSSLVHGNFSKLNTMVKPHEKYITAIGSNLSGSSKHCKVWGTGFWTCQDEFHGGEVLAVRGKVSDEKMRRMGYKGCEIYGDAALLMPLIYKPQVVKKYKLGIIPHFRETEFFKLLYADKYKVIDLRTVDAEQVIDEIVSCEYILSSSLHGIIVAHAYGVPTLWINNFNVEKDGTKFLDYFTSVDIRPYIPFRNFDEIIKEGEYDNFFSLNSEKSLPTKSIESIQKALLKVAPFPLLEEFKNFAEKP